ncbi:MAG: DNA polymerase domain-containing protein [Candidatus Hodarchaeota archaeon]
MKLKDIKIITGWTNDMGNIFLLYRMNGKKHISTVTYPWYFYIRQTENNLKLVKKINKLKTKIEGDFIKIYYDWSNSERILSALAERDIKTYEADLSPLDLLLLDKEVDFEDNFKKLFFDIETDDRSPKIEVGRDQIISFAWYDENGNKGGYCGKDEKKLLLKIKEKLSEVDMIIGYNSSHFDLPYIQKRFRLHNISFNWDTLVHIDLMLRLIKLASYKVDVPDHSLKSMAKYFCNEDKYDYPGSTWECLKTDKEKLFKYNLRDAELLYLLDKKLDATKLMALTAKWCNSLLKEFWVSKLCDMFILKHARKDNIHYKTKPRIKKSDYKKGNYIGGFVIEPTAGLYKDVYVLDFKMLYSSIIQTFNISVEKLLSGKSNNCITTLAGIHFDREPGIVASIIEDLMKKRYEYKDKMNQCEFRSPEYESYRISQDTIKEICNSMSGILGDIRSRYYNTDVVSSITLAGRFLVKLTCKVLDKFGYKGFYGDTDSVFVTKTSKNAKDINEVLIKLNKYFEVVLKKKFNVKSSSIKLEFEHKYDSFFILTKKRYVGYMKKENSFDFVGLEAVKSDTVLFGKGIQRKVLEDLLSKNYGKEHYFNYLTEKRKELLESKFKKEQLIIRQKAAKHPNEYKSKLAHIEMAKEMVKRGKYFWVGMTIEYIVKRAKPKIEPILPEDYKGEFDREYYWNKRIYPMTERVLENVFKDIKWDALYID